MTNPYPSTEMDFDPANAKAAIAGDADALFTAFYWRHAPQGPEFWIKEHDRLEQGLPLTPEAERILRGWIAASLFRAIVTQPNHA